MIHSIRTSKFSKIIASYLAIQLIMTSVQPSNLFALTGGPSQPEFNSFTPIGTSDMVSLASGDFNYNIPIMDVGGYPLNLSYESGISMDQEASWVGLGWNLSVGQINRQVRGLPDDFNGDEIIYENNLADNITVGADVKFHPAFYGVDVPVSIGSLGLGVDYNNYTGWSYTASTGVSARLSRNVTVGMSINNSNTQGITIAPDVSLSGAQFGDGKYSLSGGIGTAFNSRQGLMSLNVNTSLTKHTYSSKLRELFGLSRDVHKRLGTLSGSKSFLGTSYTPTKRTKLINRNFSANGAIGVEFFGIEGQLEIYAYATHQSIAEKINKEKAYGFNYTENATDSDVLDFNRENDRTITKNVNVLPVTNYTYDLYTINGQGISGMYQPFRSQVGYVFDDKVKDLSRDGKLGIELGGGNLVRTGIEFRYSPSQSKTGLWSDFNPARSNFIQTTNNSRDYEKVFYKSIGELNVDNDSNLLFNQLGGEEPIKIGLTGSNSNKQTLANKYLKGTNEALSSTTSFDKINRSQRLLRNQAIQGVTKKEVSDYYDYDLPKINADVSKNHHIVQTRVLQPDGSTYVFGQPAYNTKKVEATFNVSGNAIAGGDATKELVSYSNSNDNTTGNSKGRDNYFNRVVTPGYVHTYLLSEVLSSDYEDLTGDGPSDDDLGAYTKIHYTQPTAYNWRVPFEENTATSNKGLNTLRLDDMGNYIYGEKELFYVDKIETKTHVAVFDLLDRNDGYGVSDENGGLSSSSARMKQINTISLYSKPEFEKLEAGDTSIKPIKVAHFEYDYSLCKGVPNNDPSNNDLNVNETKFEGDLGGKLTLKSVYFTYRGSNMGRYTPYTFNYDGINPNYHVKGYNLWGNYKNPKTSTTAYNSDVEIQITDMGLNQVDSEPTTAEFPYVDQFNRDLEDDQASAWTMTSIGLPSGGKLQIDFEADDYAYVQDKKAMQMFKVRGVGSTDVIANGMIDPEKNLLYETSIRKRYIYVELPNESSLIEADKFKEKYLSEIAFDPIFFKFLIQMDKGDSNSYDYVSGYFKIDNGRDITTDNLGSPAEPKIFAAIPVRMLSIGDTSYDNNGESPFSKAGWYFGRQYLNRVVYGQSEMSNNFNILEIAETVAGQITSAYRIFQNPNDELKGLKCAQRFSTKKSWIRLNNPINSKIGGDVRVAKIEMFDQWDTMTENDGNDLYKMSYGQEYTYNNIDGSSTGVATFEPFGSKENPFVMPFYDDTTNDGRLLAPKDRNFTEKPLGISFFPSPKVTYSKVEVKNLNRGTYNNGSIVLEVGNNGTGKVVSKFYTSKEFPTIAKNTVLGDPNEYSFPPGGISMLTEMFNLNFLTEERLSMSQGFTVITNDMNGKMKSQEVYSESSLSSENDLESNLNNEAPISKVEYFYNEAPNGGLNNKLLVIDELGEVKEKVIGVDYNVVNDFRQFYSRTQSYGADVNIALVLYFVPLPPYILPVTTVTPVPQLAFRNTELRTVTTTKVIHKTGILIEKKAYDLGAEVTTKNIAWDATTGQVILTETDNEYKDKYYNFSYPAYWNYKGMAAATNNLGISLAVAPAQDNFYTTNNASEFLFDGDEVLALDEFGNKFKAWVTQLDQNSFSIIGYDGKYIEDAIRIKVMRSGYRNLQSANMASITLMKNPINQYGDDTYDNITEDTFKALNWDDQRIINASAVKYQDIWPSQCECNLPELSYSASGNLEFIHEGDQAFNPYLYNIRGDWRANESYAYLTGRYNGDDEYNPRNSGFFNDYSAFYKIDNDGNWYIDETDEFGEVVWTSASQVTQYSPFGAELENKDALNRFSSAQYGYNYNLPVAVASNSEYKEIGFDGFEDYNLSNCEDDHFSFKKDPNLNITSDEAHSGNNSIKVASNSRVTLNKRIVECEDPTSSTNTPIAEDDIFYNCGEAQPYPVLDVLENDTFNATDIISVVAQPSCGTITILDNGTPNDISDDVLYANGLFGLGCPISESFTYQVCNTNGECNTATVNIYICQ